jgi:riboflavin synthase
MFTGLVQKLGRVKSLARASGRSRLCITHTPWEDPLGGGESVCVQGVCLTVARVEPGCFHCDLLDETLQKSNLGSKRTGDPLNLERALRPADRLGGHIVSGHVDGTGAVAALRQQGADRVLSVFCGQALLADMVPKGSVACDGASLTLVTVDADRFSVHLIPTTLTGTTLGGLSVGQVVNVETDMLGKYARRGVADGRLQTGVTLESLTAAGFLNG